METDSMDVANVLCRCSVVIILSQNDLTKKPHRNGSTFSSSSNGRHFNLSKISSKRGSAAMRCFFASSSENVRTVGRNVGAVYISMILAGTAGTWLST